MRTVAFAFALLFATPALAQTVQLAPYKDRMFALPQVLESRDGGAYRRVDYSEGRDVNGRDEVPGRKVRSRYVSFRPRSSEDEGKIEVGGQLIGYAIAGRQQSPSVVTIYVHGRGGDRRQGMNDRSFGGNFNRLKNLMVRNGGLHIAPDIPDDPNLAISAVGALVRYYGGSRNVVVACGSQGAAVCYGLLNDAGLRDRLAGIALLGGFPDRGALDTLSGSAPVPIYLGHGTRDTVYPARDVAALYEAIRSRAPGYPVQLVLFENGIHGTPIRMTDWRETINWMLRGGQG